MDSKTGTPRGGASDLPAPSPKRYTRKPDDAIDLPPHLTKMLDVLLMLRKSMGEPSFITHTYVEIAQVYGCCRGHAQRLVAELCQRYPDISIEPTSRNSRRIHFGFTLAGIQPDPFEISDHPSTRAKQRRRSQCSAGRATEMQFTFMNINTGGGAPGATLSIAPGATPILLRVLENTNTTLPNGSSAPQADRTSTQSAEPTPTSPNPNPAQTHASSTADREAELARHWDRLAPAERDAIDAQVLAARPAARRFANMRRQLCLGALEVANPDLYPAVVDTPAVRAPVSPPVASTVEQIRRLADPGGAEAVDAVVGRVVAELGDYHSVSFHRTLLADVASGSLPAAEVAKIFARSKQQQEPRRAFGRGIKGLRSLIAPPLPR